MHILEVRLHRYKRLELSGIETLTYKPSVENQMILGSNGSGKSSLLDNLTPFFPDRSEMNEDGYKYFEAEHNGALFKLTSTYGRKSAKHSFVVVQDDVETEYNTGGTGSAQKILIEQHFNITVEMMEIWLGRTRFTKMSPIKRRDLILNVSGSDLNVAMKMFQLAKSETRTASDLEKHFTKRLAEETDNIADQARIRELEDSVERITAELHEILTQKDNRVPSTAQIQLEIESLVREFADLSSDILTLHLVKPACLNGMNKVSDIEKYLTGLNVQYTSNEEALTGLYQNKKEISETLTILENNGVSKFGDLKKLTAELDEEAEILRVSTPLYKSISEFNIQEMLGSFKAIKPLLTQLLTSMYDNSDQKFTKDLVKDKRLLAQRIEQRLGFLNEQIVRTRQTLEHYRHTTDVTCPSCHHGFKPGFSDLDPNDCQAKIDQSNEEIQSLEKQLKEVTLYLEESSEYALQVRSIRRLIEENPTLSTLWDSLQAEDLFRAAPIIHLPTVNRYESILENCISIQTLIQKSEANKAVIRAAEASYDGQSHFTNNYLEKIDGKIDKCLTKQITLKTEIGVVDHYLKHIQLAVSAQIKAQGIRDRLESRLELLIRAYGNKALNELAGQKQVQLANASHILNTNARQDAVIKDLEKERLIAAAKHRRLERITKTLSPVDGLISKYIQNFIDVFIESMNEIIHEIWTYDLEILSCGVDTTDVTCKFPLSIKGGQLITEDVSKSSAGQADIIDFAFKLIVWRYLGLTDFPLYLDELAPTLDEQHRVNLIRYLNRLMESGTFNQMYMISHYSSNHYAFPNAQYLVLDRRNIITLPKEYNQHAEIRYKTYTGEEA